MFRVRWVESSSYMVEEMQTRCLGLVLSRLKADGFRATGTDDQGFACYERDPEVKVKLRKPPSGLSCIGGKAPYWRKGSPAYDWGAVR